MKSGDSTPIAKITDKKEIETFVDALKIDKWILTDIPRNAKDQAKYKMHQADTKHLGETSKDDEKLEEIGTIKTFKATPIIRFTIKNVSLGFKVPEDVVQYLDDLSK